MIFLMKYFHNVNIDKRSHLGIFHGVKAHVLNRDIIGSEFKLQSCYIHLLLYKDPWEMHESPYHPPPSNRLDCTSTIFWQACLWHYIIHEG